MNQFQIFDDWCGTVHNILINAETADKAVEIFQKTGYPCADHDIDEYRAEMIVETITAEDVVGF